MAKKHARGTAQKRTPSGKRAGAGLRAEKAAQGGKRRTAGATPKGKAKQKAASNPPRPGKLKTAKGATAGGRKSAGTGVRPQARKTAATGARKGAPARTTQRRPGGTGVEQTLAQTPQAGRSRKGPTNPLPTRRSTGTPTGAGSSRSPRLERDRKRLRKAEEEVPTPPSTLDMDRRASAARSGRRHLQQRGEELTATGPAMTGGDVDANWGDAYTVGDEAPGGDHSLPDQDRVDEIGRAVGVEYQDNEELKGSDKITDRDRHRWELDPASSEDYRDRE